MYRISVMISPFLASIFGRFLAVLEQARLSMPQHGHLLVLIRHYTPKRTSTDALAAYGAPLRQVTEGLNDSTQRHTSNLVCALHLLSHCQVWISRPCDHYVSYSAVMAHLLPEMIAQDSTDPFDFGLLIVTCIPVIVAAMTTDRNPLKVEVLNSLLRKWKSPRPYTSRQGNALPSLELHQLLQSLVWIRSPRAHREEIRDAYEQAQLDYKSLSERMEKLGSALSPGNSTSAQLENAETVDKPAVELARRFDIPLRKLHAQYQIACTVSLAMAMFLNAVLRAIEDPVDQNDTLVREAIQLTEDILRLSRDMLPLHPQYSGGLSVTMVVAWGAEIDAAKRKALEAAMAEHQINSIGQEWMRGGLWWQNYLTQLNFHTDSTVEGRGQDSAIAAALDPDTVFDKVQSEGPIGRCVIL